jgi:hypothetical protein
MLQIDGRSRTLIYCSTVQSCQNTLQIILLVIGFLRLIMNFIQFLLLNSLLVSSLILCKLANA